MSSFSGHFCLQNYAKNATAAAQRIFNGSSSLGLNKNHIFLPCPCSFPAQMLSYLRLFDKKKICCNTKRLAVDKRIVRFYFSNKKVQRISKRKDSHRHIKFVVNSQLTYPTIFLFLILVIALNLRSTRWLAGQF